MRPRLQACYGRKPTKPARGASQRALAGFTRRPCTARGHLKEHERSLTQTAATAPH